MLLVGALLVIGAACQNGDVITVTADLPEPPPADATTATPDGQAVDTPQPEETAPAEKSFSVTAKRYAFTPDAITVDKGDRVTLSLKAIDVVHGFSLPDFGIEVRLPVGETVEVTFVADRAGTFLFTSQIFSGKGVRAEKGTVVVNG